MMGVRHIISLLLGITLFFNLACERIPDWEREGVSAETSDRSEDLLQLKRWLWSCKGVIAKYAFGGGNERLGRSVEDFLDYFRTKGLNTIETSGPKTLLGTALVWSETGHAIANITRPQDVRDIECSNGLIPWVPAEVLGIDRSLDLSLIKINLPENAMVKQGNRWMVREEAVSSGERLSVLSSAYPGQLDRVFVSAQAFAAPLQTGIDDDLVLFLPAAPALSTGGVLVDERLRVVGYLLQPDTKAWGAALRISALDAIINSILKDGVVKRPYTGFKARYDSDRGFVVQQIDVGSPSHQAGLRVQDQIVEWDGQKLQSLSDWDELTPEDIGRFIPLKYQRGTKLTEAQLKVVARE